MKKAFLITLVTFLSLGAVSAAVYAVNKRFCDMSPADRADKIAARITKELDLTDDQKAKLNSMKAEIVDKITKLHADREKNQARVIALVKSDTVTESDIDKLLEVHESKKAELKPFMVDIIIDFHRMLTPEQRNKLAEKMETFHNRCGHFDK